LSSSLLVAAGGCWDAAACGVWILVLLFAFFFLQKKLCVFVQKNEEQRENRGEE